MSLTYSAILCKFSAGPYMNADPYLKSQGQIVGRCLSTAKYGQLMNFMAGQIILLILEMMFGLKTG